MVGVRDTVFTCFTSVCVLLGMVMYKGCNLGMVMYKRCNTGL